MAAAAPSPEDASLPRVVAGFRLLRVLGRGGMGVVYEAEDEASGRRVALKVLARELTVTEEAFERFRREARIAASVSDSSCVFVFGAHQVEGAPAIAMELCAGETLEHRIASGDPVPVEDAVRWTIEILDGLEAAHRVGVVHRDVKPSNCFITSEGRIKVGDFGLARSLERDVQLTRSGVFLGSPLYASPEQVRGRGVDLRSDLYSVGATLYALLTGRSPYHGENLGEVLARILSEPPEPPRTLRPDVPRGLEKVVLKAMARDPAQRFQSHDEMRQALAAFASRSREAASPVRRLGAFLIDSGVQSLLQIPLMGLWARFDPSAIRPRDEQRWQLESGPLTFALGALGFAYFAISEGGFRRTVGKWLTGQRVVLVRDTSSATLRCVLRAFFWTVPGLVALAISRALEDASGAASFVAGSGILALLATLLMISTMRRRNGWRGVHELLSGTRVVAEPLPFARLVRERTPPSARLEESGSVPVRLGDYATVGRVGRTPSGELYEASDTDLDRRVWIHVRDAGLPPPGSERRSLESETRLRWLDGFDEGGRWHDVFEAPGGSSLLECCATEGGLAWPTTHAILSTLARETAGEAAPRLCPEQLWVDRSWKLRVLDEPVGECASPSREPLDLLGSVARAALGGGARVELPRDLPGHAEATARRLLGLGDPFASVDEARDALAESSGRPLALTSKVRGLQLLLGSGLPVVACGVVVLSTQFLVLPQAREIAAAAAAVREASTGRAFALEDFEQGRDPTGRTLDEEDLRARAVLVANLPDRYRQSGQNITLRLSEEERALVDRMRAAHEGAAPQEIARARERVEGDRPPGYAYDHSQGVRIFRVARSVIPAAAAVLWAVLAVVVGLLLRGGVSLRLVSIAVRDARGRPASRLRCGWRALLAAVPVAVIYLPPAFLAKEGLWTGAWIVFGLALALHAVFLVACLRDPARSWHDRIARTWLVPR